MNAVSIYDLLTSDYTPVNLWGALGPVFVIPVFLFTAFLLWSRTTREDGRLTRKGKIALIGWGLFAVIPVLMAWKQAPGQALLIAPFLILSLAFIYVLGLLRPRTGVAKVLVAVPKIALTAQPVLALAMMIHGAYQAQAGFVADMEMGNEMAAGYSEMISDDPQQDITVEKTVWVAEDAQQTNRAIWTAVTLDSARLLWNAKNPDMRLSPDRGDGIHALALIRAKVEGITVMPIACHYRDGALDRVHFLWAMTTDLRMEAGYHNVVAVCPEVLDTGAERVAPEAALTAILD